MIKEVVLNILDYLRYQVVNDKCTPEELRSIHDAVITNLEVDATIKDMAEFYGQKESNVRTALSRRYIGKPKRNVYYNFTKFHKVIPNTWFKSRHEA